MLICYYYSSKVKEKRMIYYDHARENLEKIIESYVALKGCYLHNVYLDGDLEIEEPTGYFLWVSADKSRTLFKRKDIIHDEIIEDTVCPSESIFNNDEIELLALMSKQYADLVKTDLEEEKRFSDFDYEYQLIKKHMLGISEKGRTV